MVVDFKIKQHTDFVFQTESVLFLVVCVDDCRNVYIHLLVDERLRMFEALFDKYTLF